MTDRLMCQQRKELEPSTCLSLFDSDLLLSKSLLAQLSDWVNQIYSEVSAPQRHYLSAPAAAGDPKVMLELLLL